ncbi:MAG: hypothetical protein KDA21_13920 [Phycisphaerales bacterium]|nr:hypothetical protein [Phycisphaerales bacterium]
MGLMRKCLSAFGARSRTGDSTRTDEGGFTTATLTEPKFASVATLSRGVDGLETANGQGGSGDDHEDFLIADSPVSTPQNKRELMEELQKNYREVVSLVRKVNTHLDRVETRSTHLMDVADRLEPALDRLAEDLRSHGEDALAAHRDMTAEVISAIRNHLRAGLEGQQQLVRAVQAVGEQISTTATAQSQLVTTMAHFRETMNGIARSNEHAGHVLESLRDASQERDQALTSAIRASFRWNLLIFITSTTLGLGALGVALYLLLNQ